MLGVCSFNLDYEECVHYLSVVKHSGQGDSNGQEPGTPILMGPNGPLSVSVQDEGRYKTSLTVSLVSKRYMRGVAEMKFSSLFVRI